MPLSPQKQAERRARLKTAPVFPKKACGNCGKPFLQTTYNKKFCKRKCKDEFQQVGPLKLKVEKLVKGYVRELEARISRYEDHLNRLLGPAVGDIVIRLQQLESKTPPLPSPANRS